MKKLLKYVKFDANSFFKEKTLMYIGSDKDEKGYKATVCIVEDKKNENLYEKFTVRFNDSKCLNNLKIKDIVVLKNVTNCIVFGDYKEHLLVYGEIWKNM